MEVHNSVVVNGRIIGEVREGSPPSGFCGGVGQRGVWFGIGGRGVGALVAARWGRERGRTGRVVEVEESGW